MDLTAPKSHLREAQNSVVVISQTKCRPLEATGAEWQEDIGTEASGLWQV